ncbi:TPA: hypothetical protein QCX20_003335 [Bacillus toyonensis]|nr:hypothetical protein [Bacillus toyonensis]
MSFRDPFFSTMPPMALSHLISMNNTTFIAVPAVNESRFSARKGEIIIFEVPGVVSPRLIAIYWPDAVPRGIGAAPTPFLVYFHPATGQNVPNGYYENPRDRHDLETGKSYSWGFDYQFLGFWRYMNYEGDTIKQKSGKGLPDQIDASGKNAVLVLPLNKAAENPCDEAISFTDATFLQEHLEEIQAFMFRALVISNLLELVIWRWRPSVAVFQFYHVF